MLQIPILQKLDWAEAHRDTLQRAARAFLDEHRVTTIAKSNADSTEYVIYVKDGIDQIPIDFSWMIGDVVHNARAALDNLAWSLARNPNHHTAFPIWDVAPTGPGGQRQQPSIAGGVSAEVKRLVKKAQPYVTWADDPLMSPLYWLRELNNIDKHKHYLTVACSDGGYHRKVIAIKGDLEEVTPPRILEPGAEIARYIFTEPNPGLEFDYQPIPYISVRGITPALDEFNIVGELYDILYVVRQIVIAFTAHMRR